MEIGRSNGVQKCPICLRKKKEAIDEQMKIGTICDNEHCPFHDAINDAIETDRNKSNFTFGSKINKFTFGSKKKKFTFGNKGH